MSFRPVQPRQSQEEIAQLSKRHLEQVVRVDSQSDESSKSIPSTPSQAKLAEQVANFFRAQGAEVERDDHANVVARIPGRGAGAKQTPMALMVHLDTSRGTRAVDTLHVHAAWTGDPIPYPENPGLRVGGDTYPAVAEFLGQDIVHGPGRAPFGLDDKLGLAHLMTLSVLLASNPEIPHPPLLLIGRPDEEIGRMEAVQGLAVLLAERGVRFGYTVDGILPFEVNVENFNASNVAVTFASRALETTPSPRARTLEVFLGGVNTHGATAHAEGHRNANRLAVEVIAQLDAAGLVPDRIVPVHRSAARGRGGRRTAPGTRRLLEDRFTRAVRRAARRRGTARSALSAGVHAIGSRLRAVGRGFRRASGIHAPLPRPPLTRGNPDRVPRPRLRRSPIADAPGTRA
jgi:tripeptide aminopeptidase